MTIQDMLKNCEVRDNKLILHENYTKTQMEQLQSVLNRRVKNNNIPNWRIFALSIKGHEQIFVKNSTMSNTLFGGNFNEILSSASNSLTVGGLSDIDKKSWGYIKEGTESVIESTFIDTFGFYKSNLTVAQKKEQCRVRAILNTDEEILMLFCSTIDGKREFYSSDFLYPLSIDNGEASLSKLENAYGDSFIFRYDPSKVASSRGYTLKDDNINIIILLRRGSGICSRDDNVNLISKDFRDQFCICETNHSITNLLNIGAVSDNSIKLEFKVNTPNNYQVAKIFQNI